MKLAIETDLGGDPDDFFAICYLIAAGVDIKCIVISPGYLHQVAIAKFICRELGLDIPIGAAKGGYEKKFNLNGFHQKLLKLKGHELTSEEDGVGARILRQTFEAHPDCEFFGIGPLLNMNKLLEEHPSIRIPRATMQGGFLAYQLHNYPCVRLHKFEGKLEVPSFNPNGCPAGMLAFAEADIPDRQFVCKNVCHTVVYDNEKNELMGLSENTSKAYDMFKEAMRVYGKQKKFHDPTAAVCHLHPEVASWVRGKPYRNRGCWGTRLQEDGDKVIADIDRDLLWEHIIQGT